MRLNFLLLPFIYIYYFISYLFIIPYRIIRLFMAGLYYTFRLLIRLIVKATIYIVKYIHKLILLLGRGIKTIVISITTGIISTTKYLFKIIKYFFEGLYTLIKKVGHSIKVIVVSLYTFIIKVGKTLWRIIKIIILSLYNFVIKAGKTIWHIIKMIGTGIYTLFMKLIKGIVNFINGIYQIIRKGILAIINTIKNIIKGIGQSFQRLTAGIKNVGNKIKMYFINRYNNLALVKYIKNKKDFQRKVLLIDFLEESANRSEQKIPYKFVAKNKEGKIISGYFDAYSKIDVHSFLLAEGAEVYSIETSKFIKFMASLSRNKNYKISYKDLAFTLTQLSTYIKSGIPLVDSLRIISRQTRHAQRKKIFDAVIYEVVMGANFSEALEKQGPAFPRLLINMIKTSELTGQLAEVLDNMSEYYDSIQKTRSQMLTAMLYPAVVFVLAVGVIIFVMIYVIPQFVEMFRNMEAEIPTITRVVINTSDFLQHNFFYVISGVILLLILLRFLYTSVKAFRYIVQWLMMHTPVIGKIIIYNEVTMFSKTFSSLLIHNVYITESMEILSKITNNEIYKLLIFDTISNLARGEQISKAFHNHWAFPVIAYEMLATGEQTGEVGVMMGKVGDYYAEQHKLAIGQVKSFIEPVMIVFLAGTVGTILLSIIVPMFQMYQQFS